MLIEVTAYSELGVIDMLLSDDKESILQFIIDTTETAIRSINDKTRQRVVIRITTPE